MPATDKFCGIHYTALFGVPLMVLIVAIWLIGGLIAARGDTNCPFRMSSYLTNMTIKAYGDTPMNSSTNEAIFTTGR